MILNRRHAETYEAAWPNGLIEVLNNRRNIQAVANKVTRYLARNIIRSCFIDTDEDSLCW